MEQQQGDGADVELELGGQKVNVRNVKSVNTILTFLSTLGIGVLCYAFWTHLEDSRSAGAAFVGAIKEQTSAIKDGTQAQREATCYQRYAGHSPQERAEFCKTVTR